MCSARCRHLDKQSRERAYMRAKYQPKPRKPRAKPHEPTCHWPWKADV